MMLRSVCGVFLATLVLGAIGAAAEATSDDHPQPQGLGQLLIQDSQSDSPVRLNVARYHVNVVIQPPVALVQIDQSFYNPFDRQQEGQFVFNLPQGASVSRFAMYVTPTELIEGELIERQKARDIYRSIVSRRRDPAILEQIGENLFKMRVFPVFARDEKRILLDYTLPLEPQDGQYEFRLPLLSDLKPIWDFRITGSIRGEIQERSLTSVSHPKLAFEHRNQDAIDMAFAAQNYQPETDLVLKFAAADNRSPTLQSYVAEALPKQPGEAEKADDDGDANAMVREQATYFLAEIPPEPVPDTTAPADVLLLLDTSSSSGDLQLVRATARRVVESLRPADRVRLFCVDVATRPLHEGWLSPKSADTANTEGQRDENSLEQALERLEQEFALGGTDLDACLKDAVRAFDKPSDPRRRLVIYVGDGADASRQDQQVASAIYAAPQFAESQAALVGIAVRRTSQPTDYLQVMAEGSGGIWFDLAGDVRADSRLGRWLQAGMPSPQRVSDVTVEGAEAADLFWPRSWPAGEPLTIYGRMATARKVKLTVVMGRGPETVQRQWNLTDRNRQDDVFVGRLWAQKRLRQLRRQDSERADFREQIVALSQEWSLLSPYTAFLVLESESDYERWNIDRRFRHRYWKPADVRPEAPLPPDWLAAVTPSNRPHTTDELFQRVLKEARDLVRSGDHAVARARLLTMAGTDQANRSEEYTTLNRQAMEGLRSENIMRSHEQYRRLFDPSSPEARLEIRPDVLTLVRAAFRASPEFLRRHPNAEALLQDTSTIALGDGRTLAQLAETLAELTGVYVALDRRALDNWGIAVDTPVASVPRPRAPPSATEPKVDEEDPFGPTQDGMGLVRRFVPTPKAETKLFGPPLSVRSCVRHLLQPLDLVLVEEPHRLLITTLEEVESRLTTEVYPVADLLFTDRVAPLSSLGDPYLAREMMVRKRIEAKLNRPISLDYSGAPLELVASELQDSLGEVIILDEESMDDVGLDIDLPVFMTSKNMPVRDALRWILKDADLAYTIEDEALVITTPEAVEMLPEVRLHSVRGVLYEYPASVADRLPGGGSWNGAMFGGMGGGFGGGMGGMGGGMGGGGRGFGGGMGGSMMGGSVGGGSRTAPRIGGSAGLSSGGDDQAVPNVAVEAPTPVAPAELTAIPDAAGPAPPLEEVYEYDVDEQIELVTTSLAPTSWDTVGGPGRIEFFPNTLDFVVSQTSDVHEQIETLFQRLRSMPPVAADSLGGRPATVHPITSDSAFGLDFDGFIDLIRNTVAPTMWDFVGGPGSIEWDSTRAALVVSQTQDIQDDVVRLLTMLRRSRYEVVHGTRPWQPTSHGLAITPTGADDLYDSAAESGSGIVDPEELELLSVRREPDAGVWTWRRSEVDGPREEFTIRRDGSRLECWLASCRVQTDGDAATVAWPSLQLVEYGDFAEAFRRLMDGVLPWIPHRSNREIAEAFDVQRPLSDDGRASDRNAPIWIRLVPRGLPPAGDTYIEIGYGQTDGAPVGWKSFVGGELVAQIRFSHGNKKRTRRRQNTAVLLDPTGRELVRWQLVLFSESDSVDIPAVTDGLDGYLMLDHREQETVAVTSIARVLAAIREFDWALANDLLQQLPPQPQQNPLVQFLQAWCLENAPQLGARQGLLDQLASVARHGSPDLLHHISGGVFPSLSTSERYGILAQQPASGRTVTDELRLSRVAVELKAWANALRHIEAAQTAAGSGQDQQEQLRLHVQVLLELGRQAEAISIVEAWLVEQSPGQDSLAAMAEVLAAEGQRDSAERLFQIALSDPKPIPAVRYHLLRRLAATRNGMARWETLLEAAESQPTDSPGRFQCLVDLRRELKATAHAEIAGRLASRTREADLAAELRIRQAELTSDVNLASDLTWQVYRKGRLGEPRLSWATRVWYRASDVAHVIEACERHLRSGRQLPSPAAKDLAAAYQHTGRQADARRAATSDPIPVQNTPPDSGSFRGGGMF